MNDTTRRRLKAFILDRYDHLLARLAARLGSHDLAGEALHDAYVRLERAEPAEDVRQPAAYVLRMASNIASNRRRGDGRLLSVEEVAEALDVPDEAPDPAAAAERASDLEAVRRAMADLPERRRALLVGMWLDEISTADLARLHGVSVRTVQNEVKLAIDEIRGRLGGRNVVALRREVGRVS